MALSAEESNKSLFERLGGKDAVNAAVDIFYDKIMADDRINYFFEGIDMPKQRAHQKAFLTYALGGAPNYEGRSLREGHKKLVEEKGLAEYHFDAVAENLQATLEQLNVPAPLVKEVMGVVGCTRHDVLNQ